MTYYCPVCMGRVRVERVNVVVEGDLKTTTIEGVCEKCGVKFTLTNKMYLKKERQWHTRYPAPRSCIGHSLGMIAYNP